MGIPTLIAQLVNLLYNIVDRIYIGHIPDIGATALTGVGLVFPITLLVSASAALVMGGSPLVAMALGKEDVEEAKRYVGCGAAVLGTLSVVLGLLFYAIREPVLYLFGASDATYVYAESYISVYLCGTFFIMLALGLNTYITAQGRSKDAMISTLIGAVLNIALDPVFIFALGMGVRGAALATVISQAASCIWVIRILTGKKTTVTIERKYLRIDFKVAGKIFSLGVSPFIMQSTESLIYIVMYSMLAKYGNDLYVGTLTIMQSIMSLISVPIQGFTYGTQPIVSYNYGAGKMDRVKKCAKLTLLITTIGSALLTAIIITFPGFFAGLFTSDAQLRALTASVMPIFLCGMLIFGIQMGCQTVFLGLGQAKISLFIAVLRKVILLVPLAIILPTITQSVYGVYAAEPIADATAAIICGCLFIRKYRKLFKED